MFIYLFFHVYFCLNFQNLRRISIAI